MNLDITENPKVQIFFATIMFTSVMAAILSEWLGVWSALIGLVLLLMLSLINLWILYRYMPRY